LLPNLGGASVQPNLRIAFDGPIRAALLVALLQTPHRFRTKRQLWAYSGFALETHDSGEYRMVRGKLRRTKDPQVIQTVAKRSMTGKGPLQGGWSAILL
jgi:transposase